VSKTADEGSDIDRECVYQLARACPVGLERDLRAISRVEGLFGMDPSGVYPRMDFDTRIGIAVRSKSSRVGPVRRKTRSYDPPFELATQAQVKRRKMTGGSTSGPSDRRRKGRACAAYRLSRGARFPRPAVVYRHHSASLPFLGSAPVRWRSVSLIVLLCLRGQTPWIRL